MLLGNFRYKGFFYRIYLFNQNCINLSTNKKKMKFVRVLGDTLEFSEKVKKKLKINMSNIFEIYI